MFSSTVSTADSTAVREDDLQIGRIFDYGEMLNESQVLKGIKAELLKSGFVSVLSGFTVALHFNNALLVSKGLESINASEGSKGL